MRILRTTKRRNVVTRYLPILIILLSLTVMIGSTLAYFSDNDDASGEINFSKVELSESTEVGMESTLYDVLPGSKIIDNIIQFSKSIDSEPIYVRAKLSFSLKDDLDAETKVKMTPYLRALQYADDFGIMEEEQHGAIWSEKEANYFYLLNSDGNGLKVVDTIDTYILADSITVPRSVDQLEGYAQYLNAINFHMAFQAIQADHVTGDLPTLISIFDSVFPEAEEEEYVYPDLILNFYNEELTGVASRVYMTREDVTVLPSNPESSDLNKVFEGWYTDKQFTQKFAFGSTIKKAVDLYPNYEMATNPADFIFDGNTIVKYGGADANVVIPRYYSMSDTPITRTVYITNEQQFLDYTGSAGVQFPLTVTYDNNRGTERVQSGFTPNYYPCSFEIDSYFTYAKGNADDIAVTAIGENCFYNISHINTITLHDNITSLSAGAMRNLSSITYLELPESILTIGAGAFGNNNKLKEVYNRSSVNVSGLYVSAKVLKSLSNSNLYIYDDGNVEWVFYKDDNGYVLSGYNSYNSINVTTPSSGIVAKKLYTVKEDDVVIDNYAIGAAFDYSVFESVTLSNAVINSDSNQFNNYLGYVIDATSIDFKLNLGKCDNLKYYLSPSQELAPTSVVADYIYIPQSSVEESVANADFEEVSYGDFVIGETIYNGYFYIRISNANARAISYTYLRSVNQLPQRITGTGTEADPYIISNIYQWKDFASRVNGGNNFSGKYINVTKDITFNSTANWMTWSNSVAPTNPVTDFMVTNYFYGKLDGKGNTLHGLYINSTSSNVALFNSIYNSNAYIKNLNIDKSYIYGSSNVAGLVYDNRGTISNCAINGVVAGANVAGIAINNNNVISNSRVSANLNGINNANGIAIYNNGQINYSIFDGVMYSPNVYGITSSTSNITGSVAIINLGDNVRNIYPIASVDARIVDSYALLNIDYSRVSNYTIYGNYDAYAKVSTPTLDEENLPYSVVNSIGISMALSATYQYHKYIRISNEDSENYYRSLSQYLYGTGTEEDPYTIASLQEWNIFANLVNARTSYRPYFTGEYVSLISDIVVNDISDLSALGINTAPNNVNNFVMAGQNSSNAFTGIFNGNNHVISGIYLVSSSQYVGVFGIISNGAEVNNLSIDKSYIASTHVNYSDVAVGGIAGVNNGKIGYSSFSGRLDASQSSAKKGGIVGINSGNINNCITVDTMSTDEYFAALVYTMNNNATIVDSYAIINEDYNSVITKGYMTASVSFALIEAEESVINATYNEFRLGNTAIGVTNAINGYVYIRINENGLVAYFKCLAGALNGEGTEENPYTISSVDEWNIFTNMVKDGVTFAGKYVELANDITFNDVSDFDTWSSDVAPSNLVEFNYVGNDRYGFSGTFNGKNHSLIGIYNINNNYNTIFIKLLSGAKLTNLTIEDSYFGGVNYVAGFVVFNYGTIENCAFVGKIITSASNNVATIASINYGTVINNTFIGIYTNGSTNTYAVANNNSSVGENYVLVNDTQINLRNKSFRDSQYVYYPTTNITTAMRNANYKTLDYGEISVGVASIVGVNYVKYGDNYYRAINASLEEVFVPDDTIVINSVEDWNTFAARVNAGENLSKIQVELGKDIVFNNTSNWNSWSSSYSPSNLVSFTQITGNFAGVFDGKGFALKGIYVNTTNNFYVFNSLVSPGVIKNLTISESYIYSTQRVSGLVNSNGGTIDNFTMDYKIESTSSYVMGVSYTNSGTILSCVVKGTIISQSGYAIGVVYENNYGYIDSTYVTANISSTNIIVGIAYNSSRTISNTLVEVNASGTTYVYPLVANMNANLYSNTYAITKKDYNTALTAGYKNADKLYASIQLTAEIENLTYSELIIGGQNVKISNIHNSYRYFAVSNGADYNYYKSIEMQMNGLGTEDNPYIISNVEDWNIFANKVNSGNTFTGQYVALSANISFNDTANWQSWSKEVKPSNSFTRTTSAFQGTFDGKNYAMTGIYINATSECAVFYSNNGTIKNLSILNSYVYSTSSAAGFIYSNNGYVDNCNIRMNIESATYASGFAYNAYSTIEDSKFEGEVKGNTCAAGFVYSVSSVTIRNCEVGGRVEAVNYAAGFIYNCSNYSSITSCFVDAFVNANSIAGIIYSQYGTITDCLSNITFGSEAATIYPTIYTLNGTVTNCYAILDLDYEVALDRITNMGDVFVSIDEVSDSVKNLKYTSTTISGLNFEISERYNSSEYVRINTGATYNYYKALLVELNGSGTQNDPYIISNAEDWISFASKVNNGDTFMGKFIALSDNIVFNDTTNWESWGRYVTPENMVNFTRVTGTFAGTFNGKDYALKGIYLSGSTNMSIFTLINEYATIKNLTIDCSYIYSSNNYAVGLVYTNYGTIQNCLINANIEGINYAAIGVTYDNRGSIIDVGVIGDLTSSTSVVGITYINRSNAVLQNCLVENKLDATYTYGIAYELYGKVTDALVNIYIGNRVDNIYPLYYSTNSNTIIENCYVLIEVDFDDIFDYNFSSVDYVFAANEVEDEVKEVDYNAKNIYGVTIEISDENMSYDYIRIDRGEYDYYQSLVVELQGAGTEEDPILITSVADYLAFASRVNSGETFSGKYLVLTKDIVFNDPSDFTSWNNNTAPEDLVEFTRITTTFAGTLDGRGFALKGIYISQIDNVYLIYNTTGTIKNLSILDSYIYSYGYVGIIYYNRGTIDNVTVNARLESGNNIAFGFVYYNYSNAFIKNSTIANDIKALSSIYAISYENSGTIDSCVINTKFDTTNSLYNMVYYNYNKIINCIVMSEFTARSTGTIYPFYYSYGSNAVCENNYLLLNIEYETAKTRSIQGLSNVYAFVSEVDNDVVNSQYTNVTVNEFTIELSKVHNSYNYFKLVVDGQIKYYKSMVVQAKNAGTEDDPHLIESVEDWNAFVTRVNSGVTYKGEYVQLSNDIEFNDISTYDTWTNSVAPENYVAFAKMTSSFAGYFDGKGYALKGIYQSGSSTFNVFYTLMSNAYIKNLKVTHVYAYTSNYYSMVGIVNTIQSNALVENCEFSGNLTTYGGNISGIALENSGRIINCRVEGSINITSTSSSYYASGIAYSSYGEVADCVISIGLNASRVAGVCYNFYPYNTSYGSIKNCLINFSIGNLTSYIYPCTASTGYNSKITDCYTMIDSEYNLVLGKSISSIENVYAYVSEVSDEVKALTYTEAELNSVIIGLSDSYRSFKYAQVTDGEDVKYYKSLDMELEGDGTQENPFVISSVEEWRGFATQVNGGDTFNGKFVELGADITFNDTTDWENWSNTVAPENLVEFTRITSTFAGTLDGKNYKLIGIYSYDSNTETYMSIIRTLSSTGMVKNLNVEKSYLGTYRYAAGLVYSNNGTIENCSINAIIQITVNDSYYYYRSSGLVDTNSSSGVIKNCIVTGAVKAVYNSNGLMYSNSGTLTDCYVNAAITGRYPCAFIYSLSKDVNNLLAVIDIETNVNSIGMTRNSTSCKFNNSYVLIVDSHSTVANYGYFDKKNIFADISDDVSVASLKYTDVTVGNYTISVTDTIEHYKYVKVQNGEDCNYYKSVEVLLSGSGTEADPYTISNLEEWIIFANLSNSSGMNNSVRFVGEYISLIADIEVNDTTDWETWSNSVYPANRVTLNVVGSSYNFGGIFNGNNHSISGIYSNSTTNSIVFRTLASGAEVNNLIIEKSYIYHYSTSNPCGVIAYTNNGIIRNCIVNAKLDTNNSNTSMYNLSGIVYQNNADIINCLVVDPSTDDTEFIYPIVEVSSGKITKSFIVVNEAYETVISKNYKNKALIYAHISSTTSAITSASYATYTIGNKTIGYTIAPVSDFNYVYVLENGSTKYYKSLNIQIKGSGTEEDPYTIGSVEDWNKFALQVQGGNSFDGQYVTLTKDIVFNDASNFDTWTPSNAPENLVEFEMVGFNTLGFGGIFDGKDYSLSGIYLTSDSQYTGIFACLNKGAVIRNLSIEKSLVVSTFVSNRMTGYTAGLVGYNRGGTIQDSVFEGGVHATNITSNIYGLTYNESGSNVNNSLFIITHRYNNTTALIYNGSYSNVYAITSEEFTSALGAGFTDRSITYALLNEVGSEVTGATTFISSEIANKTIAIATIDSVKYIRYNGKYYRDLSSNLKLTGSGTAANPYKITSVLDWNIFANLSYNYSMQYFELTNNIVFNDTTNWESWSYDNMPDNLVKTARRSSDFYGYFDGKGYTISGIYMVANSSNGGLFRYVSNSSRIANINIEKSYYYFGADYNGALIGSLSSGTVTNINVEANIVAKSTGTNSTNYVGGIVGYSSYNTFTITDCTFKGSIINYSYYTSGIINAYSNYANTVFDNCSVEADISGASYIYGISYNSNVTNSDYKGTLSLLEGSIGNNSSRYIYGITSGTATNSTFEGDIKVELAISFSELYVYGITYSNVTDCSFTGDITINTLTTARVYPLSYNTVINSTFEGDITIDNSNTTSSYNALVYGLGSAVTNCYFKGDINVNSYGSITIYGLGTSTTKDSTFTGNITAETLNSSAYVYGVSSSNATNCEFIGDISITCRSQFNVYGVSSSNATNCNYVGDITVNVGVNNGYSYNNNQRNIFGISSGSATNCQFIGNISVISSDIYNYSSSIIRIYGICNSTATDCVLVGSITLTYETGTHYIYPINNSTVNNSYVLVTDVTGFSNTNNVYVLDEGVDSIVQGLSYAAITLNGLTSTMYAKATDADSNIWIRVGNGENGYTYYKNHVA